MNRKLQCANNELYDLISSVLLKDSTPLNQVIFIHVQNLISNVEDS